MAGDNEAIEKLNKTLKPGEKPWRMISKEDLEHALRRCIELSADGKEEDAKKLAWEIGGELGFKKGEYYRTSTIYNEHGYSYCHYFPFSFSEGHFQISGEADSSRIFKVKLVR